MIDTEEIKTSLREIYARAMNGKVEAADIPDSDVVRVIGLDSIIALEVLILAEQRFGIVVEDEDLNVSLVDSLDTLAQYIKGRLAAQESTR